MKKTKLCDAPIIYWSINYTKTGRQIVERTEKVMDNNRMVTVPTNNKADTIWVNQCCKVETLRY